MSNNWSVPTGEQSNAPPATSGVAAYVPPPVAPSYTRFRPGQPQQTSYYTPGAPPPGSAVAGSQAAATPANDAQAQVQQELDSWGLGSLTSTVWNLMTTGASDSQVLAAIRATAEYKQRFAGMAQRTANGLNAISEADYLNLEDSYRQIAQANGLLPGSYDPAQAIGNDVSANEFNTRAQIASKEIFNEPPQFQTLMLDYYGLQPGQIASYYLNPTNAVPRLQQMLYAGEVGGEASALGYGLSRQVAESVANAGFTGDTARSGLAQVASEKPLFDENITDQSDLTPEQGVQAQFGLDAGAIKAVQDRAARRTAINQAGGGNLVTSAGVAGQSIAQ